MKKEKQVVLTETAYFVGKSKKEAVGRALWAFPTQFGLRALAKLSRVELKEDGEIEVRYFYCFKAHLLMLKNKILPELLEAIEQIERKPQKRKAMDIKFVGGVEEEASDTSPVFAEAEEPDQTMPRLINGYE